MATPPEKRNEKIENAKELLAELSNISPSSLARKEELSRDINFQEAVPYFEEMLDIIKQLNQRDISRLTTSQVNQIIAGCNNLKGHINNVQDFELNQNSPADVCTQIINQVKAAYDSVMEPLTIPLAFTATQATDYARIEREAKGYHATMREEAQSFKTLLDNYRQEAEKALNAVKEQAAEAGVSTNAQIFLTESTAHANGARTWLKATIAISGVTLAVAIVFVCLSFTYKPADIPDAIQYVFSKVILLSVLSFGIFWSAKNFRSAKHNETLNKHRANALGTFRAFVEGSDDPAVKDAILLQTSQAAFSNRRTGYEGQEADVQSVNPVVEILGKSLHRED
ncbi:hypothetical protein F3N42_11030 [Marinihelvus fidelis]|uniref:Uncharacterized protein n=1 Tax=Marinihelvus fidelis TaxID=2613842 RepID=A0A5N0T9T3_9GAMM|nr:hypothetical protein [Marinihelvus fidelis]KAA9130887.1 hypothetical protein F3N42_11030 [Marinihelvus fidelis]